MLVCLVTSHQLRLWLVLLGQHGATAIRHDAEQPPSWRPLLAAVVRGVAPQQQKCLLNSLFGLFDIAAEVKCEAPRVLMMTIVERCECMDVPIVESLKEVIVKDVDMSLHGWFPAFPPGDHLTVQVDVSAAASSMQDNGHVVCTLSYTRKGL